MYIFLSLLSFKFNIISSLSLKQFILDKFNLNKQSLKLFNKITKISIIFINSSFVYKFISSLYNLNNFSISITYLNKEVFIEVSSKLEFDGSKDISKLSLFDEEFKFGKFIETFCSEVNSFSIIFILFKNIDKLSKFNFSYKFFDSFGFKKFI